MYTDYFCMMSNATVDTDIEVSTDYMLKYFQSKSMNNKQNANEVYGISIAILTEN